MTDNYEQFSRNSRPMNVPNEIFKRALYREHGLSNGIQLMWLKLNVKSVIK